MKKLLIIFFIVFSLVLIGCREKGISGNAVIEGIVGCEDSDGGINKDVQGVVTVGDEDYSDDCVAGLLVEYYCDDGNKANQNIRCDNECRNGKCI